MHSLKFLVMLSFCSTCLSSMALAQCGTISIKNSAEYNAYAAAITQTDRAAKIAAIEQFLLQYPNSPVKVSLLETLTGYYPALSNDAYSVAERLVQADPNNIRGLAYVVYFESATANGDKRLLGDAAAKARTALNAPKPVCMSDSDFEGLWKVIGPIFNRAIAADPNGPGGVASSSQASAQTQATQVAAQPAPQQTDDGAAQRAELEQKQAALEQQKQDIADKISDLQSDMQEQQSEAENWDQEAEQLSDTSNCSGISAAICRSIAQIGVSKAQVHAREAREAAQRDQEQINDLQGQSNDLDQQISSATSTPAAQQPVYNPNALVDLGNQQAAQIRAIGNANAAVRSNNASKPAGVSPGAAGQNSKWCNAQHVGVVNAGACPGW